MYHKLKLAKSFPTKAKHRSQLEKKKQNKTKQKKKEQKQKTFPISKELLNHKTITILRITKIPAHTHLGMHASSNKQIPQRKWLRKKTRANSQHKQNITRLFCTTEIQEPPLCRAGWMQMPGYAASAALSGTNFCLWENFVKSKTAAFNHFSKILKKLPNGVF